MLDCTRTSSWMNSGLCIFPSILHMRIASTWWTREYIRTRRLPHLTFFATNTYVLQACSNDFLLERLIGISLNLSTKYANNSRAASWISQSSWSSSTWSSFWEGYGPPLASSRNDRGLFAIGLSLSIKQYICHCWQFFKQWWLALCKLCQICIFQRTHSWTYDAGSDRISAVQSTGTTLLRYN